MGAGYRRTMWASHVGADDPRGNAYLAASAEVEGMLADAPLETIVVRRSLTYGAGDPLTEALANGAIPDEAKDSTHQPLYVDDLAAEWIDQRCVGRGALVGDYADVGHHESLVELRAALAARVVHHGLHDLDAATLRLTVPRAFTQEASRYVFDQTAAGQRRWNGLSYLSKHGDDLRNWAVFEPAVPDVLDVTEFNHDDRALITALALHDLTLE